MKDITCESRFMWRRSSSSGWSREQFFKRRDRHWGEKTRVWGLHSSDSFLTSSSKPHPEDDDRVFRFLSIIILSLCLSIIFSSSSSLTVVVRTLQSSSFQQYIDLQRMTGKAVSDKKPEIFSTVIIGSPTRREDVTDQLEDPLQDLISITKRDTLSSRSMIIRELLFHNLKPKAIEGNVNRVTNWLNKKRWLLWEGSETDPKDTESLSVTIL